MLDTPFANLTDLTINGQTGDDVLQIDGTWGNPVPMDGGSASFIHYDAGTGTDSGRVPLTVSGGVASDGALHLVGATVTSVTHDYTNGSTCTIDVVGTNLNGQVRYSALEGPIDDDLPAGRQDVQPHDGRRHGRS